MDSNQNNETEKPAIDNIAANEQNILPADTPPPAPSENQSPPSEIIPPQTQPPMEVHHHGHVHEKKKWKEYLFQFLMLFLAVFCGFFAEYKLEHTIEHQRESEYMQSLAEDLRQDIKMLDAGVNNIIFQIRGKDSLVQLIDRGIAPGLPTDSFYNFHWKYVGYVTEMPFSKRTMNQLLNAGGLRLVRNKDVSDAIASYASKVEYHEETRQPQYVEMNYKALYASSKLIDTKFLRALTDSNYIRAPHGRPVMLNTGKAELKEFSFMLEMDKENCILLVGMLKRHQTLANDLLQLLQKEYKIK